MGSGSSSAKKKTSADSVPVVSAELIPVQPREDLQAVKLLKEQTAKLENTRDDKHKLDKYIKAMHDRQKGKEKVREEASNTNEDNAKLVTDKAEKTVEELIDYIDKINVTFDDMQGSLELFHDAVVKTFEQSQSDVKKQNVRGSINDIISSLNKKIKSAKDRTSVTKQQNVTPDILQAIEAELKEYLKMKEDIDEQNKILEDKRQQIRTDLKQKGIDSTTIEDILQWKDDVIQLQRKYGHVITENDQASEETKAELKDIKDKNESLKSELDTLQNQCLESYKNTQKANDSVQKVEEKILEERLNHEVEINALKALLEKKDKLIKKLGGSTSVSPISQSSDEEKQTKTSKDSRRVMGETPKGKESKDVKTEITNDVAVKTDSNVRVVALTVNDNDDFESKKNTEMDENDNDRATTQSVLRSEDGILSTREIAIVQVPEDLLSNRTSSTSPQESAAGDKYASAGVQVTAEEIADAYESKLDDKERTSSDLGLSVKSEYIESNADIDDNDSNDAGLLIQSKTGEYIENDGRNRQIGFKNDANENKEIGKDENKKESEDKARKEKYEIGNSVVKQDVHNNSSVKRSDSLEEPGDYDTLNGNGKTGNSNRVNTNESRMAEGMVNNDVVEMRKTPTEEDAFLESFSDMIQLVSKDECITALETTEDDVHMYEGTTKEIVYKRNDGGIDWDVAYHKGIGAVVRTTIEEFGIDTIRVDIIDEVESNMLPDLVLGERPISFHLHIRLKDGVNLDLQDTDVKLFVPHRPLKEYEDVTLIYSVNGEDWEDCDIIDEYPASVESEVDIVGTVLSDIRDVKLVVIARERMVDLTIGEGDLSHLSSFDESIRVNISKDTFRSPHTVAKLLVHHSHILDLQSAISMHEECRNISSCTAFISIVCASVTRSNILVDMDLSQLGMKIDEECPYTMFCLNESGWKLADCTWDLANRRLTINLMPGSRSYRVIGIEVPMSIHMEERLSAVKTLHEHTSHYQVCLFVRQRLDDPQQAVAMCLRSHLVGQAIVVLKEKGFSVGESMSALFCIMDGDVLSISTTGNIMAKPVNSDKLTMTFYPQKEMSTRLLLLLPVEADDQQDSSSGIISIIKHETDENVEIMNSAISLIDSQ